MKIFKQLAGASTLYTDNTGANVNGSHKVVFVSTDKDCVLYQYRSSKGDAGIQGTPVEVNPNTLVHDHDVTFYHYGSHHQECLAHVLRYLTGAKENEPDLTWHGKMHKLLQEMIVFAKENRDRRKADDPQVRDFRKHYLEVLRLGEEEYRKFPPDNAFRDGFNLCSRMRKYMDDHLFFLSHPEVEWTNNISERRLRLFKRKQKNILLEHLQKFDTRINALEILNNDVYIGFEGVNELLPLGMTGDGLRRYLNIVACSANPMTNVIVIDEIDNGLHYSAYKKLWEAIFALATKTNKQVFITTHSKETLYCLNEMLEERPEYQQEMRLYTIAKTLKKGHQAYKYTYEGLSGACENGIELRGIVQ